MTKLDEKGQGGGGGGGGGDSGQGLTLKLVRTFLPWTSRHLSLMLRYPSSSFCRRKSRGSSMRVVLVVNGQGGEEAEE